MPDKSFNARHGLSVGVTSIPVVDANGNVTANSILIGAATLNSTSFSGTANNATYLNGKTEDNLNVNSASTALTANNADYLDGQHGAYYTNATNISTGTLAASRLPSLYLGTTTIQSTSANQAVTGISTLTAQSVGQSRAAPTISAGTLTLDLNTATVFDVTLNANITTLTINNVRTSGTTSSFILDLTADGTARTIAWPASFRWPGGTAPTITSTLNKTDIIFAFTHDAGTTWYAFISGQNL